ncbi:MAG: 50S ribosomal protein L4 [Kiritimatiellae bacterium]|nr:50S ribosomal protein L4 [Kiritimatiellia bacterium]
MSTLPLKNLDGQSLGEVKLSDALQAPEKGGQAVRDAVVAHQANLRAGSAHTLGKGAVAGTGQKPWRQKGTGRARAGYARSPVWRGGGVAHGPHTRDFGWSLPRKAARLAFRHAWGARVDEAAVSVLEDMSLAEPKTKLLQAAVRKLGAGKGLLIIVDRPDRNLSLAARNLKKVEVATAASVNTYSLLRWPAVVVTRAGLAGLERRMSAKKGAEA